MDCIYPQPKLKNTQSVWTFDRLLPCTLVCGWAMFIPVWLKLEDSSLDWVELCVNANTFGVANDITSPTAAMIPKIAKVVFIITFVYTSLYRNVSTIKFWKKGVQL